MRALTLYSRCTRPTPGASSHLEEQCEQAPCEALKGRALEVLVDEVLRLRCDLDAQDVLIAELGALRGGEWGIYTYLYVNERGVLPHKCVIAISSITALQSR